MAESNKARVRLLAPRAVGLSGQILQEESQKPRKRIPGGSHIVTRSIIVEESVGGLGINVVLK
jgi:hypothetical protein